MNDAQSIGWIGTGVMGAPMAGHLMSAGHRVTVYNRTKSRADELVSAGATWSDSPADLAAQSDVVFSMLGYPDDVREVMLGEGGVVAAMRPGSLLIDMTTSEPSLAVEIAQAAAARDVQALDAPVSGGDVGARNATLVIMVGGEQAAFDIAKPLFDTLGRLAVLHGGPGSGQHTKMVNQIAIAAGMVAMCEAMLYAQKAGLDVERVIDTIKDGAAGSWSLANYGPRLLRDDLEPGFKIDHFVKDLGIALAEARRMRLPVAGTALAEQLYVAAQAQGFGAKGTQALLASLASIAAQT